MCCLSVSVEYMRHVCMAILAEFYKKFPRNKVRYKYNKFENGNEECFIETTTRPKSRKQVKAINVSSTQENIPHPETL